MKTKKLKQADALKLAQKKFGKGAWVRDRGLSFPDGELRPQDDEDRAKLRAELQAILDQKPTFVDIRELPRDMTIGAYLDALDAHNKRATKWKKERDAAWDKAHFAHRFEVGHVVDGMFSTLDGVGNTWEEALVAAKCLSAPPPEGVEASS